MRNKNLWKAFNIKMPDKLIPLYNFLQDELNFILTNYKEALLNIDLTKHRGYIWVDLRDLLKDRVANWKIHNKTWHSYILFENIRRELESKNNNMKIFELLKENNFTINQELREMLCKHNLYPTNTQLRNMIRSGAIPQLPDSATFNLDYSISEKQFFRMDNNGNCKIKVDKNKWIDYNIVLPTSVDHRFTGKIAKPRFIKRKKDGRYIGICSYEYEIESMQQTDNILGVDLGKVKIYSAVALNLNGCHSNEFINSSRLEKQQERINNLSKEYEILYKKKRAYEKLKLFNDKTKRVVDNYYYVKNKRTRVKSQQSWLIANEIVNIAIENKSKEIHLENLSWLESSAGKWNFSEIQKRIEEKAKSFEIKVVKVDARNTSKTHPITNEVGRIENRKIIFTSGEEWDRDFIAAINIAKRNKGSKKEIVVKKIKKVKTKKFKPLKSNKKEIRDKINKIKGNSQIVVFLPNVTKTGKPELVVWPQKEVSSQEYSFVQSYKDLQFWETIVMVI